MQRLFPSVFEQYNLLNHPFYVAWNEGRLTREQMSVYASEYGRFIQLISEGWQAVGEAEIAKEEGEHHLLWKSFGSSLDANKSNTPNAVPEVDELVFSVKKSFQSHATALGALYAFEAQQPATASSKLQGLKDHYTAWRADETYFRVHESDFEEPALLEGKINSLSTEHHFAAARACSDTCRLLWNALTGVMNHADIACSG